MSRICSLCFDPFGFIPEGKRESRVTSSKHPQILRVEDLLRAGASLGKSQGALRSLGFQGDEAEDYVQEVMVRLLQRQRRACVASEECVSRDESGRQHYERALVAYVRRAVANEAITQARKRPILVSLPPEQLRDDRQLTRAVDQEIPEDEWGRNDEIASALVSNLWERTRAKCSQAQQTIMDAIHDQPATYGHDGTLAEAVACLLRVIEGSFVRFPGERKVLSQRLCKALGIKANAFDQRRNRIRAAWLQAVCDIRSLYRSSALAPLRTRREPDTGLSRSTLCNQHFTRSPVPDGSSVVNLGCKTLVPNDRNSTFELLGLPSL